VAPGGAAIELRELEAALRIRHHHESPFLEVRGVRRLQPDAKAFLYQRVIDRPLKVKAPPDCPGGGQELIRLERQYIAALTS
jgi:hypothetical protein